MLKSKTTQVLGLGAACIDLIIPISESFLKNVAGEKGGAQSITLEKLNELIASNGVPPHISIGGSCANVIKGLAHLNIDCGLISTIGTDAFGLQFTEKMQTLGVTTFFQMSSQPTTLVLCMVTPDGNRTMRFFPGSSQDMDESLIEPSHFNKIKIIHIDAYTLQNGDLVKKMMHLAKDKGIKISFDLSSFEIVKKYSNLIKELLVRYVDVVFANQDETKVLTGYNSEKGCNELQKLCPLAIVLAGSKGCFVGHEGKVFTSPAFPVNFLDSTGAGDSFASGFLHGMLHNKSLETCASLGNYLGGVMTEVVGTEIPADRWVRINKMFNKLEN